MTSTPLGRGQSRLPAKPAGKVVPIENSHALGHFLNLEILLQKKDLGLAQSMLGNRLAQRQPRLFTEFSTEFGLFPSEADGDCLTGPIRRIETAQTPPDSADQSGGLPSSPLLAMTNQTLQEHPSHLENDTMLSQSSWWRSLRPLPSSQPGDTTLDLGQGLRFNHGGAPGLDQFATRLEIENQASG